MCVPPLSESTCHNTTVMVNTAVLCITIGDQVWVREFCQVRCRVLKTPTQPGSIASGAYACGGTMCATPTHPLPKNCAIALSQWCTWWSSTTVGAQVWILEVRQTVDTRGVTHDTSTARKYRKTAPNACVDTICFAPLPKFK
jgi:hypothetical protein